jgi:hypothetical protein
VRLVRMIQWVVDALALQSRIFRMIFGRGLREPQKP